MNRSRINTLNRLLAIHNRSLPVYMDYAPPWMHRENAQAAEVIRLIARDQERLVGQLTDAVIEANGTPDNGKFPMEFTSLHDLSLDYLFATLIAGQREIIATIEQSAEQLPDEPLIREALGLAKGHLDSLDELVADTPTSS